MDDSFSPGGILFDDIVEWDNEARDKIATYRAEEKEKAMQKGTKKKAEVSFSYRKRKQADRGKWPKEKMSSFSSTRVQTTQRRGVANVGTFRWYGSIVCSKTGETQRSTNNLFRQKGFSRETPK